MDDKTKQIAKLNDLLRDTFLTGKVVMTIGVQALSDKHREELFTKVREFNDFLDDSDPEAEHGNDPYGEHDFGAVTVDGTKYFWKIDYYNSDMTVGSEDPSDPKQTQRVLTIMRADEY